MILLSATVVNLRHVKHRSTRLSSLSSCFVFRVLLISITFSYFRCRRHTHIWTVARSAMPWHRFHYIHYLSVEVGFQWIGTATLRPPFWIFGLKLRRLPTNRNSRLARTKLKNIKQGFAWFPNSSTNDNPLSSFIQPTRSNSQVRHIFNDICDEFFDSHAEWNNEWRLVPHGRPRCAMAWRRICEFKTVVMPKWILKTQQMENKRKFLETGSVYSGAFSWSSNSHALNRTTNKRKPGISVLMRARPVFSPVPNSHFFSFSSVLNMPNVFLSLTFSAQSRRKYTLISYLMVREASLAPFLASTCMIMCARWRRRVEYARKHTWKWELRITLWLWSRCLCWQLSSPLCARVCPAAAAARALPILN